LVLVFALGAVIVQNRNPVQAHFSMITVEIPQILRGFEESGIFDKAGKRSYLITG